MAQRGCRCRVLLADCRSAFAVSVGAFSASVTDRAAGAGGDKLLGLGSWANAVGRVPNGDRRVENPVHPAESHRRRPGPPSPGARQSTPLRGCPSKRSPNSRYSPSRGHHTICAKSYAKPKLLILQVFHERSFAHGLRSDGQSPGFSFQNPLSKPSFKTDSKGNGALKGPLACDFGQIVW